jgi:hypothetical protein
LYNKEEEGNGERKDVSPSLINNFHKINLEKFCGVFGKHHISMKIAH